MQGGIIDIAKAYEYFASARQKQAWARIVWNPVIPPKFLVHMWSSILGRLPTVDRLQFLGVEGQCKLCKTIDESIAHLFFQCSFTRDIWKIIREWAGIRKAMSTI